MSVSYLLFWILVAAGLAFNASGCAAPYARPARSVQGAKERQNSEGRKAERRADEGGSEGEAGTLHEYMVHMKERYYFANFATGIGGPHWRTHCGPELDPNTFY